MPSTIDVLEKVLSEAIRFLDERHSRIDHFTFKLALCEGLVNAIVHGNRSVPATRVSLDVEIDGDRVKLVIADQGDGFDWRKKMRKGLPRRDQTHGRGLYLIKKYGFQINYNETGNELALTKDLKQTQ